MYVLPVVGLTAPPGPLAPIMRQNTIFGNRPRHGHHPKGNRGNQQPTIDVSQVAHHRRYLPQVLNVLLMRLFRPDNYIIHDLFQRQTGCFGFLVLTYGYFGNFFRLCHSRALSWCIFSARLKRYGIQDWHKRGQNNNNIQ